MIFDFTIPAALTTPEAQAWFLGLGTGICVRLVRAALRWFKRVDTDSES